MNTNWLDGKQTVSFDSFFPDFDLETEKTLMEKADKDVEYDLDDNFWHTVLRTHLGKEIFENAEVECVKAACRGEMALADILNDEVERRKKLNAETTEAEITEDSDSCVLEM